MTNATDTPGSIPEPTEKQLTYLHPENLLIQWRNHRDNAFNGMLIKLLAHQERLLAAERRRAEAAIAKAEQMAEEDVVTLAVHEKAVALFEERIARIEAETVERCADDGLFCDIAQLLDGWHNDGTAWSPWDESVRKRLTEHRQKIAAIRQSIAKEKQ